MEPGEKHLVLLFVVELGDVFQDTARSTEQPIISDVIVNSEGQYVVVNSETIMIQVFAPDGSVVQNISGNLKSIWGISEVNGGRLIVSDPDDHNLKVFSPCTQIDTHSMYGKHLMEPYGIAYHAPTSRVAVVDHFACCVYIHDSSGIVLEVLTTSEKPKMKSPAYVTFTESGDVLITDMKSNCLYKFSAEDGQLLWVYDGGMQPEEKLSCPCGLATDTVGNVVLADAGNNRMVVIDRHGHYINTILTRDAELIEPRGVHMYMDMLVVAEGFTGNIKVFDYQGLLKDAPEYHPVPLE